MTTNFQSKGNCRVSHIDYKIEKVLIGSMPKIYTLPIPQKETLF
jgi:hypothetical protein